MSSDKPMIKRMTQKIQIFYKKDSNSVNEFWMQFPSEYLALFSQRYKSAIWDDHQKAITIVGGDKVLYKQIFDWINASADQESAADVPQVNTLYFVEPKTTDMSSSTSPRNKSSNPTLPLSFVPKTSRSRLVILRTPSSRRPYSSYLARSSWTGTKSTTILTTSKATPRPMRRCEKS